MPLRDHFHLPLSEQRPWEGVHSLWASVMVQHLSKCLPSRYYAIPHIHLGTQVEVDVATFEQDVPFGASTESNGGVATAVSAPPQPSRTFSVDFPPQDLFEVRVHDEERASRLVAAIELVSPGNKDRPETLQAFAIKCASYLQQRVSLLVIDMVTDRQADLYAQLLELLLPSHNDRGPEEMNLHAAAYRTTKEEDAWRMDVWSERLSIGAPLPTLPLWLASNFSVLLDLESTYEETCQVLRIR